MNSLDMDRVIHVTITPRAVLASNRMRRFFKVIKYSKLCVDPVCNTSKRIHHTRASQNELHDKLHDVLITNLYQ